MKSMYKSVKSPVGNYESLEPSIKRRKILSQSQIEELINTSKADLINSPVDSLDFLSIDFKDILKAVCKDEINFKFQTTQEETRFWHYVLYAIGSHMIEIAKELRGDDNVSNFDESYLSKIFCGAWVLYTIEEINQ